MVERDWNDAGSSARDLRPSGRGPPSGPLRSVGRRRSVDPLVVVVITAFAVGSALAIPAFVGRKPVLTAGTAVRPAAAPAAAPERPVQQTAVAAAPAASVAAPLPGIAASLPPAPAPAKAAPRSSAPAAVSLDMLPVLTAEAVGPEAEMARPTAEATKPAPRKPPPQRRPEGSLR